MCSDVFLLTIIVLVDQLKDSVADFGRRHTDFARPELDFVNNLCERREMCLWSSALMLLSVQHTV